jgi:hypothetical protein
MSIIRAPSEGRKAKSEKRSSETYGSQEAIQFQHSAEKVGQGPTGASVESAENAFAYRAG